MQRITMTTKNSTLLQASVDTKLTLTTVDENLFAFTQDIGLHSMCPVGWMWVREMDCVKMIINTMKLVRNDVQGGDNN